MNAGHQCADATLCETFYGRYKARALAQEHFHPLAILLGRPVSNLFEGRKGFVEPLFGFLRPGRSVVDVGDFGSERLVRSLPRQDGMHFTEPTADRCGDRLAVAQHVEFRLVGREAVQCARQLIEHPRPGIALIADEAQRDRQRMRRTVLGDLHDVTKKRWRIAEALSGEITAHFGFGMLAGGYPPENLHHHRVAYGQ